MTKLNQIIAIEKGVKNTTNRVITDAYHEFQKGAPLNGISRNYQPRDDAGDTLPAESTLVQVKVDTLLDEAIKAWTRLYDVTITKDTANTKATADVVVDGTTVLSSVPVTYLLFLEKQLTDWQTMVRKLPTLDPAENWSYDTASDTWKADAVKTTRTKKVPRNHVKAEATDKHQAQVEMYFEDVIVGDWTTVKSSGALPASRVNALFDRAEALREAVKKAREEANSYEITDVAAGRAVFDFLLAE